jgi:methylated-DNA-[protein]-cysteine S-methyltransferase
MGQRLLLRSKRRAGSKTGILVAVQPASLSVFDTKLAVFDTELGWFGLVGRGEMVMRLFLGHASVEQVRLAAVRAVEPHASGRLLPESDWNPKLRRAIQDFARGVPTDFADVNLDLKEGSPFRQRVLRLARGIEYGRTATYGELAARAGSRGAARAIGAVMASNPVPIIIPCHRVVGSGGSLGGFSAPQGVALKRRLLEMEAAAR